MLKRARAYKEIEVPTTYVEEYLLRFVVEKIIIMKKFQKMGS